MSTEKMRELVNTQGQNGNWNYDPYMHGMYNGMELMLAMTENREPVFKEAPKKWLSKSDRNPRFTNGGGIALVLICAVIYTAVGILIGRLIWG